MRIKKEYGWLWLVPLDDLVKVGRMETLEKRIKCVHVAQMSRPPESFTPPEGYYRHCSMHISRGNNNDHHCKG